MKRATVTSVGVVLAAGLALAACGSGTTNSGGSGGSGGQASQGGKAGGSDDAILRWAIPGMPTSFDPRKSAPLDPVFLDNVYESLVDRTPSAELKPGLATKWTFSDDNKVLTFKLRQGVKFHDGETLDADAVKASLDAWRKEGALAGSLSRVDKVEVVAPDEVKITFSEPSGYMINVLAGEAGIVVSPKALDDPDLATKDDGTGPFTVTEFGGGKVSFRKFDGYWNPDAVHLGGIDMQVYSDESTRLRAVKSGQADGTSIDSSQIKEAEAAGLTVAKAPNAQLRGILLNTTVPELAKAKVRQALVYAIDREAINQSLYAGGCPPVVQAYQDGFWANSPDLNDTSSYYDPDKAKALLAEAGYPNGFDMELEVGPSTAYQSLAQALQAQLKKVGVNASIKVYQLQQMIKARRTGKFVATVALLQTGRPDPTQFVADFYEKGGVYNPGGFSVPGVPELLDQARASSEVEERAKAMQEIAVKVLEAGPSVTPVCGVTYVAAFRKGMSGWQTPVVGDYDFAAVSLTD
jgi:peptide/nickel transport system substrate-binding protein